MNRLPVIGDIIITSYGTGPYEVIKVSGPCDCPKYIDLLDEDYEHPAPRSKPHYHFTLKTPGEKKKSNFYLNGYALQGGNIKSVWSDDVIEIIKPVSCRQLSLFDDFEESV
jgi:hypothetical protein